MTYKITDHPTSETYTGENVKEVLYDVIDLNAYNDPMQREYLAEWIENLDYTFLGVSVEVL